MFVGLRDDYVSLTSSDLLYTVDTNIHHVEHWGSISENVGREDYRKEAESIPPDGNAKNTEYYKKVVGYGKQCQSRYIEWKFKNGLHFTELGGFDLFLHGSRCNISNQFLRCRPKQGVRCQTKEWRGPSI